MNNLLIISSYFPPIPGVGSRRWAKFVKYLSKSSDCTVHVISGKNTVKNLESSYTTELVGCDFKHTVFESNYPAILEYAEYAQSNVLSKIKFRVQHKLIKKKVKGNYWDNTVFWKRYFENEIPSIIENEGINTVIISGPPYRYVKYALDLKKQYPNVQLVLDYRDPWIDFNEPLQASRERQQYEIDLEKECLTSVDKILVVSKFQKDLLLKKNFEPAEIHVLRNGYDEDDIVEMQRSEADTDDKIRIAHFGTLHRNKEYYWRPFLNALLKVKESAPELYKKIEMDFIGFCPDEIKDYIKELDVNVNLHGVLDPKIAYEELNKADLVVWFKYDGSPGDFATKFGDYVALEKFIWTFSVKGEVTDHIKENGIGKVFYRTDSELEKTIYEAMLQIEDPANRTFNEGYDKSAIAISNLSKDLLEILKR